MLVIYNCAERDLADVIAQALQDSSSEEATKAIGRLVVRMVEAGLFGIQDTKRIFDLKGPIAPFVG